MWDTKHIILTAVAPLALLGITAATIVWPTYRHAAELRTETAALQHKVESLDNVNSKVELFAQRLGELKDSMNAELKVIPDDAEVALLIRRLSLPVDGKTVLDQTFTTGSSNSAVAGDDESGVAAMPLNVEMDSNFDSVFALIRSAESMERLVRIASVRIQCDRSEDQSDIDGHPILTASVGLEAIYQTEVTKEAE